MAPIEDKSTWLYDQQLNGISGSKLAALKINDDYFVSFWEVQPGM